MTILTEVFQNQLNNLEIPRYMCINIHIYSFKVHAASNLQDFVNSPICQNIHIY